MERKEEVKGTCSSTSPFLLFPPTLPYVTLPVPPSPWFIYIHATESYVKYRDKVPQLNVCK